MSAINALFTAWDRTTDTNSLSSWLPAALVTLWMQAALLLLVALLVRRWIRHPALRVTLAWAAVAGLTVLPLLALVPGWRVVSLVETSPSSAAVSEVTSAAPVDPPDLPRPSPLATDIASAEVVEAATEATTEPSIAGPPNDLSPAPSLTEPNETTAVAERQSTVPVGQLPEAEPVEVPRDEIASAEKTDVATTEPMDEATSSQREAIGTPPPIVPVSAAPLPAASPTTSSLSISHRLGVAVVGVMFATAVVVLFWTLLGKCVVWRLMRRSRVASPELTAELDATLRTASLRRRLRLLLSPDLSTPAAVGTWRPAILLPDLATGAVSRDSVRAALRHELAHIERGDLWLLAWARWLSPLYATQPLWWLFRRAMRSDQELTADAIAAGNDPVGYAEALVAWAKEWHTEAECRSWIARSWFGWSWGRIGRPGFLLSDSPGSLTRRVAMLLDPRRLLSGRISRWLKGSLVLLFLCWTVVASLVAVTEPDGLGGWWRGVVQWAQPQPLFVGSSVEIAATDSPQAYYLADIPAEIPASFSVSAGPASAHIGVVRESVAQVSPPPVAVAVAPPPTNPQPPSSAPIPRAVIRTESVVGWIDDEQVAAAAGALRLVLPEGEPVEKDGKGGPAPLGVWLKSADMSFRLNLAKENGLVKILSAPTIVAPLNETAESFSGGELPQVRIVERRNGATPPSRPIPSAVRIGLELELAVRERDPLVFPVEMTIPHLVDLKIAWSARRDETTVDRQVLAGSVPWPREGMSLFLVEPPLAGDQVAEKGHKRLFAIITPHKLTDEEAFGVLPPPQAPPAPALNLTGPDPKAADAFASVPPIPPVLVPPPSPAATAEPFQPDVQFFDPAPTKQPAHPDSGVRVKVRKLTWNTDHPKWTVNKGKPNQGSFPLNPARTWSILPFAPGDHGCVLMPAAFHVPLRRDFHAILVEQQQFRSPSGAPFSPASGANMESTQPVENGIARLGFPEPLFQTVVIQPDVTPFYGSGSAALDVIVRPEYGLLSDGTPGLKGYSGVLRMGAMLDAEIGARHADLPPSRLAGMLLNRGLPMLCPFQVPPGGGLIVCQLPSAAMNFEDGTVDDDMDRTALFISFESTLTEDNQRRIAETRLANRPASTDPLLTEGPSQTSVSATTPPAPRSLDDARKEVQRLVDDYPHSLTSFSDLRRAIAEFAMASLRDRVAQLSIEPPNESPQARLSRLERLAGPLGVHLMMTQLMIVFPERTSSSNPLFFRYPAPVIPQYADELKAIVLEVTQRGEQIEALRKSLETQPAKPTPPTKPADPKPADPKPADPKPASTGAPPSAE